MLNQDEKFKETEIGLIPESWDVKSIPDVTQNMDRNRKPLSSRERAERQGEIPYYGAAGIIDHINDYKYDGDFLLIAEDGTVTSNGDKPMLQLPSGRFWVSNHAHVLKLEPKSDLKFLYYALSNTPVTPFITGAVQPKLSQENLNKIKFPWPKITEREKISEILGTLDQKIELNQKMNKTLEEIGRAIFANFLKTHKSQIHFDSFSKIANVTTGKRPNKRSIKKDDEFLYPLIGAGSIMGYVKEFIYNEPIIITGRVGTHGGIMRVNFPCWPSDNALVITSEYPIFTYQLLKTFDFSSLNRGSTQPLITQTDIKNYEIPVLPENILSEFEKSVGNLYMKIENNEKQASVLSGIRESLLPKLMSGKVRVK